MEEQLTSTIDRDNDRVMGVEEIAAFTNRSPATVRKWFSSGELKRIPRLGASCWMSDLLAFLETGGDARKAERKRARATYARQFRRHVPVEVA